MTDEQLVLALITSYKSRGVDMSALLDDPLFSKLSPSTKVKAIQAHAEALHAGVNPGLSKVDYGSITANVISDGIKGGIAGATIGAALRAAHPGGSSAFSAIATGAGLMAFAGGLAGGLKTLNGIQDRRSIKAALDTARANPTPENAIGVLSTNHMHKPGRSLREALLARIGDETKGFMQDRVQPTLIAQHQIDMDITDLTNQMNQNH